MFPDDTALQDESLENLIHLDEQGFFPAPGEDVPAFFAYLRHLRDSYRALEEALAAGENLDQAVGFHIGQGLPIAPDVLAGAESETKEKFAFSVDWVPAYYLSRGLGLLWGGCTIITDDNLALFFIRRDFRDREKWFIYTRCELLAHETCHVARNRLNDSEFEEHFAYMTSTSPLRRFMGNCFRQEFDALIFILPVFFLLVMETLIFCGVLNIAVWPFWLVAAAGPGFLLLRNVRTRSIYARAEENLRLGRVENPRAVLFRMTREEIRETAFADPAEAADKLRRKAETDLRWKIIAARFL